MKISRDNPFLYLTSVTNKRLPVFRTDPIKEIVAKALDEARRSAGILIFAYVIMPDHMHLITDGTRRSSEALKYFNGIAAKRVIDHLKANNFEASLEKLRTATKKRNYCHSLWEHHPNAFAINNEETLIQKVNYVHQNPVRAGLVDRATDYLYSSARIWNGRPLDAEPLMVDIDQIEWRRSRRII
jgi:REP element-mobilizing transposase RayT